MNILIMNWRDPQNPKSGGAEIVTLEHAKAWQKAGHSVTWLASEFPKSKKNEVREKINFVRRGGTLSVYLWAPFYYLTHRKKVDLVIDQIHGLPFFTPLYVRKPKVAFIHEVAGIIWDYMYPFPMNLLGKQVEKLYLWLYRNQVFWVDAPSTKEELEQFGIHNTTVIPCPIANPPLSRLPNKEKNPTFIFVSRLVKMKGIEQVIISFSQIVRKMPKAKLWIVGDGEETYLKQLQALVETHALTKQVTFYGFVSNQKKLTLLRRAHLLLHASVKEGWGLVVLEAGSQGTPSVVYNVAGLVDTVKNRQTGVVVQHNSPEELAKEAMHLYLDKKRYSLYQKNGLLWVKSLSWSTITDQSLRLINSV